MFKSIARYLIDTCLEVIDRPIKRREEQTRIRAVAQLNSDAEELISFKLSEEHVKAVTPAVIDVATPVQTFATVIYGKDGSEEYLEDDEDGLFDDEDDDEGEEYVEETEAEYEQRIEEGYLRYMEERASKPQRKAPTLRQVHVESWSERAQRREQEEKKASRRTYVASTNAANIQRYEAEMWRHQHSSAHTAKPHYPKRIQK